jgi:hypothetical protein
MFMQAIRIADMGLYTYKIPGHGGYRKPQRLFPRFVPRPYLSRLSISFAIISQLEASGKTAIDSPFFFFCNSFHVCQLSRVQRVLTTLRASMRLKALLCLAVCSCGQPM